MNGYKEDVEARPPDPIDWILLLMLLGATLLCAISIAAGGAA